MEPYNDNGIMREELQTLKQSAFELMVHAVDSWCRRFVQDWKSTHYRIDHSMEEVMHILGNFVIRTGNRIQHWENFGQTLCPMQLDISFVFDKEKVVDSRDGFRKKYAQNDDSDDDDDDGYDDELNRRGPRSQNARVPFPDDIESVMLRNGTKYVTQEFYPHEFLEAKGSQSAAEKLYKRLVHEQHGQRMNVTVDMRRSARGTIRMYLSEPPNDCKSWPRDAVHEWPVNASRTCLLAAHPFPFSISNTEENVLTFSIQCRQSDSIQCYLYWQGLCHRFNPRDKLQTETVLKDIFLDTSYLENSQWSVLLSDLKARIQDTQFEYFQNVSINKKDLKIIEEFEKLETLQQDRAHQLE